MAGGQHLDPLLERQQLPEFRVPLLFLLRQLPLYQPIVYKYYQVCQPTVQMLPCVSANSLHILPGLSSLLFKSKISINIQFLQKVFTWLIPHFVVTAWIQNWLNTFSFSPIYTQYPIMTKWKHVFYGFFCKCIENEIPTYLNEVFTPPSQYFVETLLAAITAMTLSW